ncbi:MAG TPA: sigma-70 family RNA polymerase sigma factor [Longimicrobium sp.]|nr:sigma-70 family RNA polymerase sigma factor [Longimicrobium sp.]
MSDPKDFAALLEQHLPFIRRIAAKLCGRHGLDPDETDDFTSWATARLVENDYGVLRKFRGDSALTTFLTVVLSMLYRDYRVWRWGRWRPSAEARRRGPDATRLETMVYRDGYSLAQAVDLLRSRGDTSLSERELYEMFGHLPMRARGRLGDSGDQALVTEPSPSAADQDLLHAEAEAERDRVNQVLARALEGLPTEDALVVRLRFFENMSVAAIARALELEQKPLYRRLDRALARMRMNLEAAGISRQQVAELLAGNEK